MSSPPVDPSVASGGGPHPDSTDPQGRQPPSRSADPGQSSPGGFSGEGGPGEAPQPQPKGRDDDELARALRERLRNFGDIDVSGVQIAVDDGRVSLSGQVSDGAARAMIEARVAEVLGVVAVDNRLDTRGAG
jgi:hypothetical protein